MNRSECDYTIFYRELAGVVDIPSTQTEQALAALHSVFYRPVRIHHHHLLLLIYSFAYQTDHLIICIILCTVFT